MKTSLSFIALIFLISSCGYFDDPGSAVILNVDAEFEIELSELLFSDHRELAFNITSVAKLDCQETVLNLDNTISTNAIDIAIKDISMPATCDGEDSYPKGTASFTVSPNMYNFAVHVKSQNSQTGTLSVTGQKYTLDLGDARGFFIEEPEVNQIPENFVWGYYHAKNKEEQDTIESFLQKNNFIVAPLVHLAAGNYTYFSIDEKGEVTIPSLPTTEIVKTLAFDLTHLATIKEAVSSFRSKYPNIVITLSGSDGSSF